MRAFLRPLWLFVLLAAAAAPAPVMAAPSKEQSAKPAKARPAVGRPRPAIWLLADEDTKIYLLGTIHVLPPGFAWRSPTLDRIIAESDELVEETYEEPGSVDNADARAAMLLDKPIPILDRVPKQRHSDLKAAIKESRVPISFYDQMPTWAAGIMLGVSQILDGYGVDDPNEAPGVEDVLEEVFTSAGKPISSVEDPMKVVQSLNALPQEAQVSLLLDAIAKPGKSGGGGMAEGAEDDIMWARGDVEGLGAFLMKDIPPYLVEALIRSRNRAWTGWLQSRLERPGTVLFAVGAGHLAGPDSVQRMLAARGLTVTRID